MLIINSKHPTQKLGFRESLGFVRYYLFAKLINSRHKVLFYAKKKRRKKNDFQLDALCKSEICKKKKFAIFSLAPAPRCIRTADNHRRSPLPPSPSDAAQGQAFCSWWGMVEDLYPPPPPCEGNPVRQMQANQPLNLSPLLSTPSLNPRQTTTQSTGYKRKSVKHRGPLTMDCNPGV